MENLISLGHNQEISGSGTQAEVDALNKSLASGGPVYSDTLPGDFTQGNVFQTESLEPTLKVVSEIDKHIMLFNALNKSKAFQLVEEFDLQTSHGGAGSAWIDESDEQPREEDAKYYREIEIVKYMGVKKKITHVMTQIRSGHGDIVSKETKNGVSFLLRELERALWESNGFFAVAGAGMGAMDGSVDLNRLPSFNGMDKQLRAGFNKEDRKMADFIGYGDDLNHIYDVDGQVLAPEDIEESCRIAMNDFGSPDAMYLSPKAHSDFSRSYYPKERFNDGKGNIVPGTIVPAMNTSLGRIELKSGKFLTPKQKARSAADNSACSPAVTSAVGAAVNSTTDMLVGTYFYVVRPINKNGEGAAVISAGVPAIAGDYINLTITPSDASAFAFAIYRSLSNSVASALFIGKVKANGAAAVIFCDKNIKKPGTSQAYLLQLDADSATLRQLTPMLKIDFAIIGLYRHWAQVMYCTPIIYKPNYSVLLSNIKEV